MKLLISSSRILNSIIRNLRLDKSSVKNPNVQVSDTTKLNSITAAKYIKNLRFMILQMQAAMYNPRYRLSLMLLYIHCG